MPPPGRKPPDQPPRMLQPPPLSEWFPVQITAVNSPSPGQYTFQEWWLFGDGTWGVKTGGRYAGFLNPAVSIFGTLDVNDFALARSAPGAGGNLWELLPLDGGPGTAGLYLGFWAGLTTANCLSLTVLSVSGACGAVATGQVIQLAWNGGLGGWASSTNFVTDVGTSAVLLTLSTGRVRLQFSDFSYELFLEELGNGYAIFAAGGSSVCAGAVVAGCADNTLRVKVACAICTLTIGCDSSHQCAYPSPMYVGYYSFDSGTGLYDLFKGATTATLSGGNLIGTVPLSCGGGISFVISALPGPPDCSLQIAAASQTRSGTDIAFNIQYLPAACSLPKLYFYGTYNKCSITSGVFILSPTPLP